MQPIIDILNVKRCKINFEDINTINDDFDKITDIIANKINILDLSVIDKFINLRTLEIIECSMTHDDLVNYDFTKFVHLQKLIFIGNSTNKTRIDIDDLAKLINEKGFLNDIDYARKIVLGCIGEKLIYTIGRYKHYGWYEQFLNELKSYHKQSEISEFATFDELMNNFDIFTNIIFEYEKYIHNKNNEIESLILFNKNIFGLSLDTLILSYYCVNDFFNLLPTNSPLLNTLRTLSFSCNKYDSWHSPSTIYTFEFYQYLYSEVKNNKIKVDLSNDIIILNNEAICKFLLFNNFGKMYIFKYLACDMKELFEIDKNRAFVKLDEKCYNLVMYWDNKCYYWNFINSVVNFKSGITHLYAQVIRYENLGQYNSKNDELIFSHNLPDTLQYLKIIFINEYHDNYNSDCYASEYLLDVNLPSTLKKLKLINVSETMINNIKKIPHDCILKYTIFDKKNGFIDYISDS